MARYIDVDKAIESIRNGDGTSMQKLFAECCVLAVPPDDVVPMAEFERLEYILHSYALQYGTAIDKEIILLQAKTDFAREIFEEIDESTKYFHIPDGCAVVSLEKIAELKKKYGVDQNEKTD